MLSCVRRQHKIFYPHLRYKSRQLKVTVDSVSAPQLSYNVYIEETQLSSLFLFFILVSGLYNKHGSPSKYLHMKSDSRISLDVVMNNIPTLLEVLPSN